jgi:hypothetical protein
MKIFVFSWQTLLWVTVFAIAMGFLETSVVVYLRTLMYPAGFSFPLAPIPESLAVTEIIREAATIVMLIGAGVMAGKTFITRFAYFIYAFAIWDIFYYVFLKLLLNWPDSWFTWDILFLLPLVWVGPVLAPVITSLTMIGFCVVILYKSAEKPNIYIDWKNWVLLVIGSLILIISFAWDYSTFILKTNSFSHIWTIPNKELLELSRDYIPQTFNWLLFWLGESVILATIVRFSRS